jgi:protease-4
MTEQSAPVRQNKNDLLDDVYARMLDGIASGRASAATTAAGRALEPRTLRELVEQGAFTPVEAQAAGLVDAVRDDHEVEDYLKELLGRRAIVIREPDRSRVRPSRWAGPRVAVVLIDGTITEGPSQHLPFGLGGAAGADTLVEALEECRRDPGIGAVVLRVNSPGGSAYSSDVIARAVARVRAAGKPVVTSMGDVAASGGYYVAAPTTLIFAEPSTTTGSIGIFGFKLDVSRLLASLSINVEVFRRGSHADQLSPFRPWTDAERHTAESKIRYLYQLFTSTVAAGRAPRGLTATRVDEIGRGHVWTGAQARGLGLVDELGGLTAAIDRALSLGRIPISAGETPDLVVLPRSSATILQKLVALSQGQGDTDFDSDFAGATRGAPSGATALIGPLRPALRLAAPYLLGPGEGIEARLPFDLDIR